MKKYILALMVVGALPVSGQSDILDVLGKSRPAAGVKASAYGFATYVLTKQAYSVFKGFKDNMRNKDAVPFLDSLSRAGIITFALGYAALRCAEKTTQHAVYALNIKD